ncbi:hypothetical protein HFZ78_18460 [Priestia megaterium]|uniref:Uncharacterized protein n=1 Tax=Priestia megaterium TaxID=1404 RepID=A0A6H1P4V5_PRIMG|nr:hypothetical protein [Priestia megaterium]QIZ08447.1 hypothetical protein HFZ78_18460 [Priestia megaterium]
MNINGIIVWFFMLFIIAFIYYLISGNTIFASVLVILIVIWYGYILFQSKLRGIPAKSKLFRGILEVHVGNKAKECPFKFLLLFLDSILWAKEKNIDKAIFFTWYSKEATFVRYFGTKVNVSYPSFFERLCNIYINPSYWSYKTGKQPMKVVIWVNKLTATEIQLLQDRRDKIYSKLNK